MKSFTPLPPSRKLSGYIEFILDEKPTVGLATPTTSADFSYSVKWVVLWSEYSPLAISIAPSYHKKGPVVTIDRKLPMENIQG
jgi:hypothetical protein